MIVKYLNEGVWGYIDNVRQVAKRGFDCDELIKQYNENEVSQEVNCQDPCEYMNGEHLPQEIVMSNKAFMMAASLMDNEGINRHSENLLDASRVFENYPASAILLYIEGCKEYDAVLLVTNQRAFLMNDQGKTIERLV